MGLHPQLNCDAPPRALAPRWGRVGGTERSATPMRNIIIGTGDKVSRTVSERTCRREHQKQGKEEVGQGKERTESPLYGELVHNR